MNNTQASRINHRDPSRPAADDDDVGTSESHSGADEHDDDVRERGPDTGGGKLRPGQA